jgi:eukaryotic-like serine/threonine-protein kinase
MPIATGTRLGPYEIESLVGVGGMGHVHKARDTRLNRTVAIKVLAESLSGDAQLQERFNREARAISSLNHPNICTLHDVGREQGVDFLVMEYLEGQTLARRLAKGPLPIDETLRIAIQIAEALHQAHRAGITHRDLKPGNVMLTNVGAKLLDFGLARTSAVPLRRNEPAATEQANLTARGTILGTLPYMAPEQIEGADADPRSDIWALGCVLYEMVTGRPAFGGGSQASLISAIMSGEPEPLATAQPTAPALLDRVIRDCLVKDPNRRWQSAFDAALRLKAVGDGEVATGAVPRSTRRSWPRIAAGALVGATAIGLPAVWFGGREPSVAPATEVRFEVAPPPGGGFPQSVEMVGLAISPDGLTLAFTASDSAGVSRLWARGVAEIAPRALPGTEGANSIIWSPDGRSLAFFGSGKLQRLDFPNGTPVPICDVSVGIGFAGSWGESGEILFASVQGEAIYRVAASGGTPEKILEPDAARGESRIAWPKLLPGDRGFLYLARSIDHALMWKQPGKPPQVVAPITSRFELIEPDLLVFVRDGALIAQRLDLDEGRLTGVPAAVAANIDYFYSTAWAGFAVSPGGSVFYSTGKNTSRLAWLNRSGAIEGEVGERGDYLSVALSPDGRSVLADRTQPSLGTYDLWLLDLERNVETRLTSSPDADFAPTWFPDGKEIVYSTARRSVPNLIRLNLATGAEAAILPRRVFQEASDVARNGRELAFIERGPEGGFHASTLQLDGEPSPKALFASAFRQDNVRFSPDGNFIAYRSDESGEWEAYVASIANPGDRVRISQRGAGRIRWRRDGAEILFISPAGEMIGVPVSTDGAIKVGTPATLFTRPAEEVWYDFDVTADGQRFLVVDLLEAAGNSPASVILNWTAATAQ